MVVFGGGRACSAKAGRLIERGLLIMGLCYPGADPGFWSGGPSDVLTPGGPEPEICSKLPESCMMLKNTGGKGGPGSVSAATPFYGVSGAIG